MAPEKSLYDAASSATRAGAAWTLGAACQVDARTREHPLGQRGKLTSPLSTWSTGGGGELHIHDSTYARRVGLYRPQ
eukprot:scaffold28_cov515-Prasinococcus_capsulatus_cf.AAC.5